MTDRTAGRPRLYDSPEDMAARIADYFDNLEGRVPTMAGLCYSLGFEDRHALAEYERYEGFSATVKKARLRIEQDRAEKLVSKDTFTPGLIFDLKNNHGWRDGQDLNLGGQPGNPVQVTQIELVAPDAHDDSED